MRIIVTGGGGFLGQLVARDAIRKGKLTVHTGSGAEEAQPVDEVVLADVVPVTLNYEELKSDAVRVAVGDVSDRAFCDSLFEGATAVSVFHLGSVLSGEGEADFDLCMRVNMTGTINMLEAARACGALRPRFLFASTMATVGTGKVGDHLSTGDAITDASRACPHTTYGMTKACAELLLADYSRKGFVDGRGVRLPTIIVRAGKPNSAVSSCFSSVVRAPAC